MPREFQSFDLHEVQMLCDHTPRENPLSDYPVFSGLLNSIYMHLDYTRPEISVLADGDLLEILAPSAWERYKTLALSSWTTPNLLDSQGLLTISRRHTVLTFLGGSFEVVMANKNVRLARNDRHTTIFTRDGSTRINAVEDFKYGRGGGVRGFRPSPPKAHGLVYLSAGGTVDVLGNSVTQGLEEIALGSDWELKLAKHVDQIFKGTAIRNTQR